MNTENTVHETQSQGRRGGGAALVAAEGLATPTPSASVHLHAGGKDAPGVFGEMLLLPARYGCWVDNASFNTHCGKYYVSLHARGFVEHVEHLARVAEHHPHFPFYRDAFKMDEKPAESHRCKRHHLYAEAADEPQLAMIAIHAGNHGLNISRMEVWRVGAPMSGEVVVAEFLIDVCDDQSEAFALFKSDLALLVHDDQILRHYGPYGEGESGPRPAWRRWSRRMTLR